MIQMKRLIQTLTAVALALSATSVMAFSCDSTVNTVGIASNGSLALDAGYGVILICSTTGTVSGVAPDTCKTWFSQALTAKASGRQIRIFFDRGDPSNASLADYVCTAANFGNWVWRPSYYVFNL